MSRLAVLSIVLTVALGPDAAVLCLAWCDQLTPLSTECHLDVTPSTTATVAAAACCDDGALAISAFLREDAGLNGSAPRGDQAVLVALDRRDRSTTEARPEPGRDPLVRTRPLPTVLRL